MVLALTLLSGVAWTVVYVVSIRIGFQQKTYAIPAAALALNIAWESIYATHGLAADMSVQTFVNVAWAVADLFILYTFLRYGRRELPGFVSRPMFIMWSILLFATAYIVQLLFIAEFGWSDASRYAAFLQNLLMSGLFIAMFVARGGPRGQSIIIAVAKWIGTLAPTIAFGALAGSALILGLGILCSVFDLAYLGLLLWARQNLPLLDPEDPSKEVARREIPAVSPNGAVAAG
ncbi:MAG TPA: hypothetical protein VI030_08375 [Propionibacteriaceae bacterium]